MSDTEFQLIKIALYALVIIVGLIAVYLNHRDSVSKEVEKTLKAYDEYRKQRDAKYPEMIGKWGKP